MVSFMVDIVLINCIDLQAIRATCGPRLDHLLDEPNSSAFPKGSCVEPCVTSIGD